MADKDLRNLDVVRQRNWIAPAPADPGATPIRWPGLDTSAAADPARLSFQAVNAQREQAGLEAVDWKKFNEFLKAVEEANAETGPQ